MFLQNADIQYYYYYRNSDYKDYEEVDCVGNGGGGVALGGSNVRLCPRAGPAFGRGLETICCTFQHQR